MVWGFLTVYCCWIISETSYLDYQDISLVNEWYLQGPGLWVFEECMKWRNSLLNTITSQSASCCLLDLLKNIYFGSLKIMWEHESFLTEVSGREGEVAVSDAGWYIFVIYINIKIKCVCVYSTHAIYMNACTSIVRICIFMYKNNFHWNDAS